MSNFLVAGNWKMNGTGESSRQLTSKIIAQISQNSDLLKVCDFLCCPPALYLRDVVTLVEDTAVLVGGQDCSIEEQGAHTGDVSASMLKDCGVEFVILGHSERRANHNETSEQVNVKAVQAKASALTPVICVGETLDERKSGDARDIVRQQIKASVPQDFLAEDFAIAYEPVWAIGSGEPASEKDVDDMHGFIRDILKEMVDNASAIRILYGGSVKPDNAGVLSQIKNVNGFLIGGASLKAESFVGIGEAVASSQN